MTPPATNSETRRFNAVAQSFLEKSHELFPQDASAQGLHQFDGLLGENTPAIYLSYIRLLEATLQAVETLAETAFSGDDWLDRRGFLAMLRSDLFFTRDFAHWRRNPQVHCDAAVSSIFDLVVRNTENLPKALPNIESRLGKIPAFLAAGAACLKEPVPLWCKLAVQACDGAVLFLAELQNELVAISTNRPRTRRLFEGAIAAFKSYARAVKGKKPGHANGFSIGRENFEFLIRERLGMSLSLPEAEAQGRKLVEQLTRLQKIEAAKLGRGRASEIIEAAAARWQPKRPLIDEYRAGTAEMRRRFARAGLLTFPRDETLKVLPVPEFLRHQFPTAAYNSPGCYDKKQTGIFWVNDLSLIQKDPEKKKAEIRQHFGLELTCAHEAYPGHHAQFVTQNRHRSKLRRHFHHAIYYEGWTLWCEKMCIDHGIYDAPHARLSQVSDALWRAWRIIVDCGLHSGALDYKKACKVLMDGVGFTAARAQGDVNWYTSAPTVPMSYLLGRLEVEKLHAKLVGEAGWSVKKFNDWMLGYGAVPWSWIWQSALTSQNLSIAPPRR
ncbi:MAG TPA: DUF885 domain-containing protein [Chthoniobacteraceae bacterium]|nr:DUF885 domain-containing protein [Chthoniobacteraceae bacterium]